MPLMSTDYDPFARIYDDAWGIDIVQHAMPHVEELLLPHIPDGAHLLDLCCGTGLLTHELLRKGYQVIGLDRSESMLHYARQKSVAGNFIFGDACSTELSPARFHGVVSTGYSLNHLMTLEELSKVFHNVYSALVEGGLFVFDLRREYAYRSTWDGHTDGSVKEEYAWAAQRSYNPNERIGQVKITIFQMTEGNWQRSDITWLVKGHSRTEIESTLKQVGFINVSVYDAERDLRVTGKGDIVYFVCRKPF